MISKKYRIIIFITGLLVISMVLWSSRFKDISGALKCIKQDYKGIVINRYAPRKYIEPTNLVIKIEQDRIIEICPNGDLVDYVFIGDSIIKVKNENYVVIKKLNGSHSKHIYNLISDDVRNHPDWPKEWRGKWMDATLEWRRVFGKEASKE